MSRGDKPGVTYAIQEGEPPVGFVFLHPPGESTESAPGVAFPMNGLVLTPDEASFSIAPDGRPSPPIRVRFPDGRTRSPAIGIVEPPGEQVLFERRAMPEMGPRPARRALDEGALWESRQTSPPQRWSVSLVTNERGRVVSGVLTIRGGVGAPEVVRFTPIDDSLTDLLFEVPRPDGASWFMTLSVPGELSGSRLEGTLFKHLAQRGRPVETQDVVLVRRSR